MLKKKYDAKESEKKWQDFWAEKGVYKFDSNSKQPIFSIDTPPPTVNGKIHIGHIFSYSQAEIMARYQRMKGFNVFYPFGFDDNGLPTERLVEKTHNIKAHQTSREHFTELCLKETQDLEQQFKELFTSAGFSCDWDYEYSTISSKARITSQKSFIKLYNNKQVYFSEAPAIWCPECQTAIAQAELETKEIPSVFNYLKFYIDDTDEYVEIATTRPELLAACKCIFIHPDDESKKYLLGHKIRVPLFDFKVPVLEDSKVAIDKGTGVVMCCTFGDLTDLEWYKTHKFKFTEAIKQDGTMSEACGKYAGMKSLDARKIMINDLIDQGYMIKQEKISHNVATHERCGTPMEITIKKQWFIDILSRKQEYLDAGKKIEWYPAHMRARYDNWVENLEWDWCISRQRYFGVPFPVWYCKKCGSPITADIEDLPVNPLTDSPKKTCACGCAKFVPEKDIMDTWATSSVTPFINLGWYDETMYRDDMLPMSLRPNAHDIIRTWDFYTIVKSLYHTGRLPWNKVMISGHVMASKGIKISKRKSNSNIEPVEVIDKYSADAVRLWASSGSLGNDIVFSDEEFLNAKKIINKIWNASKFAIMHLEGFEKKDEDGNSVVLKPFDINETVELHHMDKWIILEFNKMLERYENYLSKYELGLALSELEKFFWNYCDNYIEIIKNRVYKPEKFGENARKSSLYATYHTVLGMLKCFAIYIPHITEEIYQGYYVNFEGTVSIHKTLIKPIEVNIPFDENELLIGKTTLNIIAELRKYKSENNISLKTELQHVRLVLQQDVELGDALDDIVTTCSCKHIEVSHGKDLFISVID